jgi:hypothetical protein
MKKRFLLCVLALLILGCGDDDPVVTPPDPLSPEDQQTVDNCNALRDAIEAYAAGHGGSYGTFLGGILQSVNPYSGEDEPSGTIGGSPGQIAVEAFQDCDDSVLGYRITGYGKEGVLVKLENLSSVPQELRSAHDALFANVRLVVDAAKAYAAANNGAYPSDVGGTPNLEGDTLVDLLPNGELLINPFTSMPDQPIDGSSASAGDIGYVPSDPVGDGTLGSFVIDAMGCNGWIVATVLPYSQKEEYVWHDALELRVAVNQFKQASGQYPHNLDTETTPGGKTVLELHTDNGYDFENPYTGLAYVPSLGSAANKGEVSYQPIETEGVVTSFAITGRGVFEEILRLGPTQ